MQRWVSRLPLMLAAALLLAALLPGPLSSATAAAEGAGASRLPGRAPGHERHGWGSAEADERIIIVKLRPGLDQRALLAEVNAPETRLRPSSGLAELGYVLLRVPAAQAEAQLARVRNSQAALSAEFEHIVYTTETIPNDPHWSQQYGPARIQAPQAWSVAAGDPSVIVAVIDSGIDWHHPDLAAKIWTNPGEVAGTGRDDDANGYVDDVRGWNFAYGNNDPYDDNGHGTHVAGIAAAASNNTLGIAGMAWGAQLMPLKVLQASGAGYDFHVAEAIVYAAKNGAQVINMSLGGATLGQVVEDAVDFAYERGVVLVAAAGNQGQATPLYPAAYEKVIAVTATDAQNQRAPYANYGAGVELAAPGSGIYSTLPDAAYGMMWGTSMAAPHVAGAAALLAGRPRFDSPALIREALQASALDLGEPGRDPFFGHGLVQVYDALTVLPACLPSAGAGCYRLFLPLAVQP
jgi:subtilisin family serine protease